MLVTTLTYNEFILSLHDWRQLLLFFVIKVIEGVEENGW